MHLGRFSAAACVFVWVPAGSAQATPAQAASVQRIAAAITANALKADVSFLASDALEGRGTPSRGLEVAAEFIASQFRRAGLEPAGDDGYFQTASYVAVTPRLDGLALTLEISGRQVKVDRGSMFLEEAAAVDLVQVPAIKISLEDAGLEALTPEQMRGKVLLIDDAGGFPALRRLPALIRRLQPPASILVRAAGSNAAPDAAGVRLREASAAPGPLLVVWDEAFCDAVAAFKPGPIEGAVSLHVSAPATASAKVHNVIGVLGGSDPVLKHTFVFVTAHYDHLGIRDTGQPDPIFNGANDDASGTASVIEIANALAALPARPRRSMVFMALFGEEMGLLGSRYYVGHPIFPLANTVADINLEQLGRTDDNTGPRVGLVNVTGYDFTTLTPIFRDAGDECGIRVVKDARNSDPFFARSDNQPFADAGIPAHTLSVGYVFPDYHQPGDEWPKLDYDNMAKVDCTVALGVLKVADSAQAPRWNADNPATGRYVRARESLTHESGSAPR